MDQLERLSAELGRENIHVIDADDLFVDFVPNFTPMLSFLGLSEWLPASFDQKNARPRSKLEPALRDKLREQFEDDDARLAAWWGHVPSWRR